MNKFFLSLFVIIMFISILNADDPSHMWGIVLSPNYAFNKNNSLNISDNGLGCDMNIIFSIFNGGVSIRDWKKSKTDTLWYLGLGLQNLFQFQYGHSKSNGDIIKIRSDLSIINNSYDIWGSFPPFDNRIGVIRKTIIISPFFEKELKKKNYTYGIGVGILFF